jgi:hypothetical protein
MTNREDDTTRRALSTHADASRLDSAYKTSKHTQESSGIGWGWGKRLDRGNGYRL